MTSRRLGLGIALLLASAAMRGNAQTTSPTTGEHGAHGTGVVADAHAVREFVERARAASSRYVDPATALRDGFQPVGLETPGMGQHWVSAARVFRGGFDVARPAGLQYATIDGHLTLVGVAYIVPLLAGESPPAFPGPHLWHMHAKTIDEENLIADHNAATAAPGPRVGILHVWAWTENPVGPFAPDNWNLPFVRAGLSAPAGVRPATARAVALAGNGAAHFTSIIQRYAQPSARDSTVIADAVAAAAVAARSTLTGSGPSLSVERSAALAATWTALWRHLDERLDPSARGRLTVLRASTDGTPD